MKILVLMPSRMKRDRDGRPFLTRALEAIGGQDLSPEETTTVEVAIGTDPGTSPPEDLMLPPWATVAQAATPSQAAALNAAATAITDHDFVAIMEDDDRWSPGHLRTSLAALHDHELDFTSSTQLQVDEAGVILSIFDFPTPSGWVMRRATWETVGPFDERFRYHLDNDWLGRLAERGCRRAHLVENTAPVESCWLAVRPWLHHVVAEGGPRSRLLRHDLPTPLVTRTVHAGSGMAAVATDAAAHATSRQEYERLIARYGRIPW